MIHGEEISSRKGRKPRKEVYEEVANREKMMGLQTTLDRSLIHVVNTKGVGNLITSSSQKGGSTKPPVK